MARGVIFDLDGVITDTAELHYRSWKALADRRGYPFDRDTNEQLRGVSRAESLRIILNGEDCAEADFERMLEEKNNDYVARLTDLTPEAILPGVNRLLAELTGKGIPVAIGSSSKNARTIVRQLNLDSLFPVIADGNSVCRSKPAPDVFIHAAGQLGIPCGRAVVVEDAVAGIEAAKAAGMRSVAVGDSLKVCDPDLLFSDTSQLDASQLVKLF